MGIFFVGAVLYVLLLIIFRSRLILVERGLDASEIHNPRIYRRVYKNDDWWFLVFKAEDSDEHILLATVPGAGCWDIAMKLSPQEVAMFRERLNDFVSLAKDFVDRRESSAFKPRRLNKFRWHGDTLEAEV